MLPSSPFLILSYGGLPNKMNIIQKKGKIGCYRSNPSQLHTEPTYWCYTLVATPLSALNPLCSARAARHTALSKQGKHTLRVEKKQRGNETSGEEVTCCLLQWREKAARRGAAARGRGSWGGGAGRTWVRLVDPLLWVCDLGSGLDTRFVRICNWAEMFWAFRLKFTGLRIFPHPGAPLFGLSGRKLRSFEPSSKWKFWALNCSKKGNMSSK